MIEWRTMGGAPKDGRLVLLLVPGVDQEREKGMAGAEEIVLARWASNCCGAAWLSDLCKVTMAGDNYDEPDLYQVELRPISWAPLASAPRGVLATPVSD